MFFYKDSEPINRKDILAQIYDNIENHEGEEGKLNDFFVLPERIEFSKNDFDESISILSNCSENLQNKNKALFVIFQLTQLSHENVLPFLTPCILQIVLDLSYQKETCLNAFKALSLFTYYTDFFNEFIYNSNLFNFVSKHIRDFENDILKYCIYLFINLFITIPLEKPLKVMLIKKLLQLDLDKINAVPNVIYLYSIIVERDDFPEEHLNQILSIFKNCLSGKTVKSKNGVLYALNSLLHFEKYSNIAVDLIRNNNLIGPILSNMNDKNFILCLTIIRIMISKDDTFSPQLVANDFNSKLKQYCQYKKEDIQYHALLFSDFYIQIFPELAKEFLDFQFENIFLKSSFKIKSNLIHLYNHLFPIIISNKPDFTLQLSKPFILEILDMVNDDEDNTKRAVYYFIILIIHYNKNFILSFNIVETCVTNEIMSIAEEHCLSENQDLAYNASFFLRTINGKLNVKIEN